MELFRFDRWGDQIGVLAEPVELSHRLEAGGESTLTVKSMEPISRDERILWRDGGFWREHIARQVEDERANGKPACRAVCEDSLVELFADKVDEKRIRSGTAFQALSAVLEQTRWRVGTVSVGGARTISFYHCSVGEALQDIAEAWGCEVYSSFDVDDEGVTARFVNLVPAQGSRDSSRRYEHGKDLVSVKRVCPSADVYTAMRGYGKGKQVGDGEWGRRITFESINGGLDYVFDRDALEKWGRPDGRGGKAHAFGTVVFEQCEDPAELMELTRQELEKAKEPRVSYECSVADLKGLGYDYEGVGIGDDVDIVDASFSPTLRLTGRVMAIERNLIDSSDCTVTIGNVRNHLGTEAAAIAAKINALQRRSANWDVAAFTPSAYLGQIIDGLNREFDAGNSYIYQSFEQGIVVGSVPLDKNTGKPTRTPASAIQLKGGGFRIANSVKGDGSFDWRTFGTGDGFVADEIVAGVLRGGSSYWNLDTGDFLLAGGAIRISDGDGNTVSIDTADGFQLTDKGGNIIAGTEVVNGKATFFVDKIGRGDSYATLGTTATGYGGLAYVQNGIPAFEVTPTAKKGGRNGVDMSYNGKHFLASMDRSLLGASTVITPPRDEIILDNVGYPRLSVTADSGVSLLSAANTGFSADDGIAGVYMDATHYMQITSKGAYFRCGNSGFGWHNGAFSNNLTWD